MKIDQKLGLTLAGVWLILYGIGGLNIFSVASISGAIMPVLALVAGILLLIR